MENTKIADILTEIADLLELQSENPFRIRSYRNAARSVRELSESLESMLKDGKDFQEIPGIGKSMSEKIREILTTGNCAFREELAAKFPPGLSELLKLETLGPKKVVLLHEKLQIASLDDLEKAALSGRLRAIRGMGEKTEKKVLESIANYRAGVNRFKLSDGFLYWESLEKYLKDVAGVKRLDPAGSFRRRRETIGDLDILAICGKNCRIMDRFTAYSSQVIARGETKSSIRLTNGLQVDLRVLDEESYGAALHYFTGSKAHNVAIREKARAMGLKISEYGVFRAEDEKRLSGSREEDVFAAVGLPFIPPELREDSGEIQAAAKGVLPRLIELKDIRGDLQMHTTATDGKHTIAQMARKAEEMGYEYISITDHSKALRMVGGLDEEALSKQHQEIEKANREGIGVRILKGIEVDILPDGALDLSDDILRQCDVVVAAVHSRFNMEEDEMTRRIIRALRNPMVNILAHPTGRVILSREPYKVNLKEVVRAAADEGVVLEVNAYPDRLDLKDSDIRLAKEMGTRLAISSDAHTMAQLEVMKYGVFTARRCWAEAVDVVNTLPLDGILKVFKSRRG
ncbi:MAG TPA: DNA polymerase/3'-5' exonuclease PolX [Thermodesulfobacteriota bacterium]|nr:DNA polymerase/3'-5' exonuclease PolX [Thermodesulfobacteriota bacterium]